jgi:hypothetical protein
MPQVSFLKELRDAARTEPNQAKRDAMKVAADALQVAIRDLSCNPTEDHMKRVNCWWSHCLRLYWNRTTRPAPGGGKAAVA